jgi:N-acetylmuramic acid 6-phosphate etherase
VTEERNLRTIDIDALPTLDVLRLLNDEDALVASSVRQALPALAQVVDAAAARYRAGGTIHYFGAGTSGRIGTLDAAELPPTFSADPSRIVAHHAGGQDAIRRAVEAAEDDSDLGASDASDVGAGDIAIGLTASGRTPYVWGALKASKGLGALTVLISSSLNGGIADAVDIHVGVDTGPEAIAGSTRLKAATAQKMILNGFSTALMIRVGKAYSNLMVDVAATNAKLRGRVLSILEQATGGTEAECAEALERADGDTKTALVSLLTDVDAATAGAVLEASGGLVREAVASLGSNPNHAGNSSPRK